MKHLIKVHEKKVVTQLTCMILFTLQADYIRAKMITIYKST